MMYPFIVPCDAVTFPRVPCSSGDTVFVVGDVLEMVPDLITKECSFAP